MCPPRRNSLLHSCTEPHYKRALHPTTHAHTQIAMAHFQEVDYCSEEVRAVGNPARRGGVQEHIVKETFVQEFDNAGRRPGHHGRSSGHLEVHETKLEEDIKTRTGEFHERKENFLVKADD